MHGVNKNRRRHGERQSSRNALQTGRQNSLLSDDKMLRRTVFAGAGPEFHSVFKQGYRRQPISGHPSHLMVMPSLEHGPAAETPILERSPACPAESISTRAERTVILYECPEFRYTRHPWCLAETAEPTLRPRSSARRGATSWRCSSGSPAGPSICAK